MPPILCAAAWPTDGGTVPITQDDVKQEIILR